MTSMPIPLRYTVVSRLFVIQRPTPGQPSARHLPGHLWIYCRHRPGLHGTSSVKVRLCCAGEPASFAISCRYFCLVSTGSYLRFSLWIPLSFLPFLIRRTLSWPSHYMYSRLLTIRSSHTRCNIISTRNGKSRRVPSSARDILERAAITSRVKQSRTLSNQPPVIAIIRTCLHPC